MLQSTSAHVKSYDGQTKWIYYLIEDGDLLEKHNIIWDKVSATAFYDKETPKVYHNRTCLAVISLGSALEKDQNYYLQVFINEGQCIEKVVIRCITEDI